MLNTEPGPKQPLPDWYMQRDMVEVFSRLLAGEFCEILGVGSAGKSNFVRHMTRPDVKRRYLQQYEPFMVMVLLNPHLMVNVLELTEQQVGCSWAGYEVMLSRLRRELIELERRGMLPPAVDQVDVITQIERRYANLFNTHPAIAQSGIRHLEDAVYEVLALGPEWQIVFIFDEAEEFIRVLPPEFFQSLRGVRDEFKGRVMYVTTSRAPLAQIASPYLDDNNSMVMEGFLELFHGFTYHLQRLDDQSAREVIRRLEQRNAVLLAEPDQKRLLQATGHHAGLIRRGFLPTARLSNDQRDNTDYFAVMLSDSGLRSECQMIFDSLSPDEQDVLVDITRDHQPNQITAAIQSLMNKHLLVTQDDVVLHTIPLLAGYLREHV